jgi:uncharacterized integral membrane protein
MNRSRFSQPINNNSRKSSGTMLIWQLSFLSIFIIICAAIFVQNLQPSVQIFLFGQSLSAIPLSVAMFVAFAIGASIASVINAIATHRHHLLIRRAMISESDRPQKTKPPTVTYQNAPQDRPKDQKETDQSYLDDEYEDDDWEDDDENWEDEDDDPDTVPYGDRPPLDAKFIR